MVGMCPLYLVMGGRNWVTEGLGIREPGEVSGHAQEGRTGRLWPVSTEELSKVLWRSGPVIAELGKEKGKGARRPTPFPVCLLEPCRCLHRPKFRGGATAQW